MNNDPNNMMNNPYGQGGVAGGYPGNPGMNGYPGGTTYPSGINMGGYPNPGMGQGMSAWNTGMGGYTGQMYPAAAPEPAGKKRTGLIAAAIAAVVVIIGCIIALTLLSSSEPATVDPVSAAMSKLLSDDAPEGVAVDGRLEFVTSSNSAFAKSATVRLKSELMPATLVNSSVIGVNVTLYNDGSVSLKLSESYNGEGEIYIKVDGVGVTLQDLKSAIAAAAEDEDEDEESGWRSNRGKTEEAAVSAEYLECLQDINNTRDCSDLLENTDATALAENNASLESLIAMIEALSNADGQWLAVPASDFSAGAAGVEGVNGQCLADFANDMRNSRSDLAAAYDEHPFIVSALADIDDEELSELDQEVLRAAESGAPSTESDDDGYDDEDTSETGAATGQDLIYQVFFSDDLLAEFADTLVGSASLKSLDSCTKRNSGTKAEQIVSFLQNLPVFYVSLDDEFNFTKIYFGFAPDGKSSVVVGLDLSYPDSINVTKPGQYKNLSAVLQN